MAIKPVVRYMIVCDNWYADPANGLRLTIVGLITNLVAKGVPRFPVVRPELRVFLALTDGYGVGEGWVACIDDESGEELLRTPPRPIAFGPDPLAVLGVPFRLTDCVFPRPGIYSIQFWYDAELIEERPIRLR